MLVWGGTCIKIPFDEEVSVRLERVDLESRTVLFHISDRRVLVFGVALSLNVKGIPFLVY